MKIMMENWVASIESLRSTGIMRSGNKKQEIHLLNITHVCHTSNASQMDEASNNPPSIGVDCAITYTSSRQTFPGYELLLIFFTVLRFTQCRWDTQRRGYRDPNPPP
ncbi:hypothetical protein TNCV_3900861 [Trichonephila clavipes]|nr:hypothetical protein TNCV_3900861 [Trichonephila clavipes]